MENDDERKMTDLPSLDKEIEVLEKEKQKAIIQQEIEKIKKTKIEETIIERRRIVEPRNPSPYPYNLWITWWNGTEEKIPTTRQDYILC